MTIATIFSVVFQCSPIESNWVLARIRDKASHQSSRSTIYYLHIGFPDGYWSSRSANEVLLRRFCPLFAEQSKLTPTRIQCIHLRKKPSRCFILLSSLCVLIPNLSDWTLTPHAGRAYHQSSDSNGSTTSKTTQNSPVLPPPHHPPPPQPLTNLSPYPFAKTRARRFTATSRKKHAYSSFMTRKDQQSSTSSRYCACWLCEEFRFWARG